ncbi:hypothetical protein [Halomonas elongata]|uniref:hypothetical protein n=1 Tax=Halomonas elongata TaxID=2746 RepID=UPI00186B96C1|nr:hypothetical protein [Halomonas elongata]MBW5801155.1 hypothetical protein [Halomonas elongata]
MNWIDKAADQIEKEYEDGLIDMHEMHDQLADLRAEAQQEAEDAAQAAYDDCMGW